MGDIPTMLAHCCGIDLLSTLGIRKAEKFHEVVGLSDAAQDALLPDEKQGEKVHPRDGASCWKAKDTPEIDSSLSWHYLLEIGGGGSTWHFYSMDDLTKKKALADEDEDEETNMVTDEEETDVSSGVETAIVSSGCESESKAKKTPIRFESFVVSPALGNAVERARLEKVTSSASVRCFSHSDKDTFESAIDNMSVTLVQPEEKEPESFETSESFKTAIEDASQIEPLEGPQRLSTLETADSLIVNFAALNRVIGVFQPILKGLLETSEQKERDKGEADTQRELGTQNHATETILETCVDSFVESSHAMYPSVATAMKTKYQPTEGGIQPHHDEGDNAEAALKPIQGQGSPIHNESTRTPTYGRTTVAQFVAAAVPLRPVTTNDDDIIDEASEASSMALEEPSSKPSTDSNSTYCYADDYPDLPESPVYSWVAETMEIRLPSPF